MFAISLLVLLVAYGGINVRLKLFQDVLVNYKIAGRENHVNKIDTNPPVAALYFESWWAAFKGQKDPFFLPFCNAKPMSQIRPTRDFLN